MFTLPLRSTDLRSILLSFERAIREDKVNRDHCLAASWSRQMTVRV
jgi:hypothetical protein